MKHLIKLKRNFAILFVCLIISGCAVVRIKNSEWCGDFGSEGSSCFNTHNDDTRDVSYQEWEDERFGMICTKAETFADWKANILKLCKVAGRRCRFEEKKNIIIFMDKVDGIVRKSRTYKESLTN